jgi:hypothetical protein
MQTAAMASRLPDRPGSAPAQNAVTVKVRPEPAELVVEYLTVAGWYRARDNPE